MTCETFQHTLANGAVAGLLLGLAAVGLMWVVEGLIRLHKWRRSRPLPYRTPQ